VNYRRNIVLPRVIAAIVDFILYTFLISLSQAVIRPLQFFDDNITDISFEAPANLAIEPSDIVISIIIALIMGLILYVYIPYQKDGKTPGKILMGIRAIDESGNNPKLWQHFLRAIMLYGYVIYLFALVLLFIDVEAFMVFEYAINIGYGIFLLLALGMIIASPDSRGPHDILSKTYVVDENYDPKMNEAPKHHNPTNWAFKETENEDDDFLSQYDKNSPWDR